MTDNTEAFARAEARSLTPPPSHPEDCVCASCHEFHDLKANYGDSWFPCCTDDVDEAIRKNDWCKAKPKEHANTFMSKGVCLECNPDL